MKLTKLIVACVAALQISAPQAQTAAPSPSIAMLSLAPMVEDVTPGVVGVSVSQSRSAENPLLRDPAFRQFFEDQDRRPKSAPRSPPSAREGREPVRPAGSGVIVDARQGIVLTNHHVIQGASRVVVVLKDRREYEAQVVGSDAGTDVAVLKIKPERLTEVRLGESDNIRVGDYVVAIGNPFGLGQTVTMGIVSALSRGLSPEGYEDYIQTDAAINPGNSGGALVNLTGELMGINTAILTGGEGGRGGNIGIGFAVPSAMAKEVMAQILKHGEVKRGRIGIQIAEVTQAVATERGLTSISGALVSEVSKGSSADKAGLKTNDVVLRFNGRPVRTGSELRNRVALVPVGEFAELLYVRDGRQGIVRIPVEPLSTPAVASTKPGESPPAAQSGVIDGLQVAATPAGLQVAKVTPGSAAESVGFREGDLIAAIDRQPVQTIQELSAQLQRPGRKAIVILRGDSKLRLSFG